jgi:hypothetical protein
VYWCEGGQCCRCELEWSDAITTRRCYILFAHLKYVLGGVDRQLHESVTHAGPLRKSMDHLPVRSWSISPYAKCGIHQGPKQTREKASRRWKDAQRSHAFRKCGERNRPCAYLRQRDNPHSPALCSGSPSEHRQNLIPPFPFGSEGRWILPERPPDT